MFDEEKSETTSVVEEKSSVDQALLEEMAKVGLLYGRKKSKTNPRMQRYIFTTRNGMEILDIVQTIPLLDQATSFLEDIVRRRGTILFVGVTPAAKEYVKALGEKFKYPYVVERWLGGTLTNFKTIRDRLQYYIKLKADQESGKLEKYTKKERLEFSKEIERLTHLFGGLESITKLPDAVVIAGVTSHETAVREARRLKIPIVGILNTDADPDEVTFPIPANDLAKSSVQWIFERLEQAIDRAHKEAQATAAALNAAGIEKKESAPSKEPKKA